MQKKANLNEITKQVVRCFVCKVRIKKPILVSSKAGIGSNGQSLCEVCDHLDHLLRFNVLFTICDFNGYEYNQPKGFDEISQARQKKITKLISSKAWDWCNKKLESENE